MTRVEPPLVTPERIRHVLGRFASGVVVVTATTPDGPAGFTCQSFASLSLAPPLVVFCPSRASASWPRMRRTRWFAVNILAAHQADVSARFARSGTDKFTGTAWRPGPRGVPVLDGVCGWVSCELAAEYDGGDHTIVTGLVRELHGGDEDRSPLVYHRGAYGVS
ncbi:flavin reductase family protein [Amycolatopsis thermophila]|uniref:Flavin reductase (DIM6/NTAB) family NADH-FMN oxidoreductase RutF n=1 Tax=Amycolatopsis thermophila TaxID=206084 RepID=A0ABU0F0Q8_9PSEU|nr:flavin reductase family protein [Amycolatopsis thermophila]MDQ0381154.1 flavin reductase (DIM6/NTAB) family NADH-FMN oxidoreductase RutF [Amycolatopsis thermophila]